MERATLLIAKGGDPETLCLSSRWLLVGMLVTVAVTVFVCVAGAAFFADRAVTVRTRFVVVLMTVVFVLHLVIMLVCMLTRLVITTMRMFMLVTSFTCRE